MPLTPAHAAAAWPIRRLVPQLPLVALVIGTMSPDFEYFFRLAPLARFGHDMPGLVIFCLPVSLATWWVYQRLVRPALLDLVPRGLAEALPVERSPLALVLVAAMIGAVSHVAWDGFTHGNRWGAHYFPSLLIDVVPGLPRHRLLQHGSTVVGAIAIVAWTLTWLHAQPASARAFTPGQRRRALTVAIALAFITVAGAVANGSRAREYGLYNMLALAAVGGMVALAVALVGYGAMARRATPSEVPTESA